MKKMINSCRIEGLLYENKLEKKTTGANSKNPGTEYITGTISVATDDLCTNIVPVHFTYVTEKTASGKINSTFGILNSIIEGKIKNVMATDKESASKVRIDSSIGLNDFITTRDGEETWVSAKRNDGGFVHTADAIAEDEKLRNTFKTDMVITNVRYVEADSDRNLPAKAIVKGYVFGFRNVIMPVEFTAINPAAISYFESLEATSKNPVFTCVWGRQVSETTTREIRQESAFGDDSVRIVTNNHKDWVITGASREPYVWDDESFITKAEFDKCIADREIYLASIKQRNDEYKASQANSQANAIPASDFKF